MEVDCPDNVINIDDSTIELYKERIIHYCDTYLKIRKSIDDRKTEIKS